MAEPLPSLPLFVSTKKERIKQELKNEIDHFLELLKDMFSVQNLAKDPTFLERVAAAIFALHGSADRAQSYDDEVMQDTVWILHTMLYCPLRVERCPKNITLLDATQHFSSQNPGSSDLAKVMGAFLVYRAATTRLMEELRFCSKDLLRN